MGKLDIHLTLPEHYLNTLEEVMVRLSEPVPATYPWPSPTEKALAKRVLAQLDGHRKHRAALEVPS